MEELKTNLDWALYYQSIGLSIIPTGKNKKSLVNWKLYQERCATVEEINTWWKQWPGANPALVTGKVSGVVALDLDKKHNRTSKEFSIPLTAWAKSGNGGEHIFFRYPSDTSVKSGESISGKGVDSRGDGGYILLEPSVNEKGGRYEWTIPLESKEDLAEMPEWFKKLTTSNSDEKKWLLGKDGVSEGSRNGTAASMAGKILASTDSQLWESIGWEQFRIWNSKNLPVLTEKELRGIWESIEKYHIDNKQEGSELSQPSQSTQLVELVLSNPDITLFLDQYQTAHVRFPIEEHFEVWPCDSSVFRHWLGDEFYKMSDGKAPGTNAISGALNVIEGRARAGGVCHDLQNRIAEKDEVIWYDLCDKEWRAIRIDKDGWKVISDTPILFRRHSYHQPQVVPVSGGNIRDVFQFVNIKEPDQQLLFLACMVSFFIPGVPHPLLYVHGQQGSAKSSLLETVHELVDPSAVGSLSMPSSLDELTLLLHHHSAFASFDNVSYIHPNTADLLCRAVTGMGFERRKLYTNSETVLCYIRANVAINGINLGSSRSDLLERSILLELSPVEKSERRQDKELHDALQVAKPSLFGAILDIVVEVLRTRPSIHLQKLFRMADFTVIGCSVAQAIGSSQQEFLAAYQRNEEEQIYSVLEASVEASLVQELMVEREHWEGSATILLSELTMLNKNHMFEGNLPKNAAALSRRLRVLKPALESVGLHLSSDRGTERTIVICKISKNSVESVEFVGELVNNTNPLI